jgi:hypothetical protein
LLNTDRFLDDYSSVNFKFFLFSMIILKDPAANKIKTTPNSENSGIATLLGESALFSASFGFAVGLEDRFVGESGSIGLDVSSVVERVDVVSVGVGVAEGVVDGLEDGSGVFVGVDVGSGVTVGVGIGVAVGVGEGVGVGAIGVSGSGTSSKGK